MASGPEPSVDRTPRERRACRSTLIAHPVGTRLACRVLSLAAVGVIGCYGPIGGRLVTPSGFELEDGGRGRTCPDLAGVYLAQSGALAAATWLEGSPVAPVQSRHLSQFFTGLEGAETLGRVAIRPSSGQLTLEFQGDAGDTRRLVLQEGSDFRCDAGRYRLLGSARVKHRDGATVHLYRGPGGALVEETLIDSPTGWLLLLPVLTGKQDGEWSSYPAVAEAR
jgi:hypothetical protein